MKTSLRFSASELTILLLQAGALGGMIVLMMLTGATGGRVAIAVATLLLVIGKVAGGVRRGRLDAEILREAAPVPR